MPYVQRDSQGRIVAVAAIQGGEIDEWLEEGDEGLRAFVTALASAGGAGDLEVEPAQALTATDMDLVRVIEDVVDLLIERNLLRFTDLPAPAQEKLLHRRSLRRSLNPLGLMGGSESGVI